MAATVAIPVEVAEVLSRGRCENDIYFLPSEQLDRKLYERVNKVLTALGAQWDRKVKGHVGAVDLQDRLAGALDAGIAVNEAVSRGFFPTPRSIAEQVLAAAEIDRRHRVLEPSAGEGDLLPPLGLEFRTLTLVEIDLRCARTLRYRFPDATFPGATVVNADFLTWEPPHDFDRIIMNPPFGKSVEVQHLMQARAWLAPGGRLVAIMPSGFAWRQRPAFDVQAREAVLADGGSITPLPPKAFAAVGTNVATVLVVWPAPGGAS